MIAAKNARTLAAEAARFLLWLRERCSSFAECRQADVDLWQSTGVTARQRIVVFLRWARARGRSAISSSRQRGKQERASPHRCGRPWAMAPRLIHDDGLDPADRVVGTLVVLDAQPVTKVAKLRRSDIVEDDGATCVRLGKELMPIAEPGMAELLTSYGEPVPMPRAKLFRLFAAPQRRERAVRAWSERCP